MKAYAATVTLIALTSIAPSLLTTEAQSRPTYTAAEGSRCGAAGSLID